jgi:hypothetical protein
MDTQRPSGHEQIAPPADGSPASSGEPLEGSGFELEEPEPGFEEEQ